MTYLTRTEVQTLAEAWRHLPEGAAGTPLLMVPMTPAAVLTLMERNGLDSIDAETTPTVPPVSTDDLSPGPGPASGEPPLFGPRASERVVDPVR